MSTDAPTPPAAPATPAASAEQVPPTQVKHPWRATVRTVVQALIALAILLPFIYQAATGHDPAAATGLAAGVLAIAAGIARVMALPQVDAFLRRFLPFLASTPRG